MGFLRHPVVVIPREVKRRRGTQETGCGVEVREPQGFVQSPGSRLALRLAGMTRKRLLATQFVVVRH